MYSLDRQKSFDFALFFAALALWVIGVALIYSATHIHHTGPLAKVTRHQVLWVVMGVVLMLLIVSVPTRFYFSLSYVIYAASVLLLLYAVFGGVSAKGAARWIGFAGIKIQPSEFAKIGLLFALARYFSERTGTLERPSSLIVPGIVVLVPFALVLRQPDLGTALIMCGMLVPVLFWAGMRSVEIFFLLSPFVSLVLSAVPLILTYHTQTTVGFAEAVPWGVFFIAVCIVVYFSRTRLLLLTAVVVLNLLTATMTTVLWNSFLKDYQKERIISFINPQQDPYGAGYQVIQSKVAVGSGAFLGKGYLKGTQTRLSFLPEQHTDFIFSVLGEQFGFVGAAVVLLLFLFVIVRGLLTTQQIRNRYTNLVITGSIAIITMHLFVNVSMTLGMMPVTGLPLPFLSYGGSFTLTVATLVGLVLNARVSSQDF